MLAMGCIKSLIIDKVSNGKVPIDMTSFLTQVVLVDLQLESGELVSSQYSGVQLRSFSYKLIIIRSKFFFPFIGRELTT